MELLCWMTVGLAKENDDTRSLGDWYPNLEKLPDGIRECKRVEAEGMKFGISSSRRW